jgi:hypothetical protein
VGLNFLELLPTDESAAFLQQRREKVVTHFDEVAAIPTEIRKVHPSVEYLFRFYRSEIEWLDEIIARLNES